MKSGLSRQDKHVRLWLRMLPNRTDRRGFTLIELLVAIMISGLILSSLLYLVVEVLGINQKDAVRSDTQRDMQLTIDYITRDLRESFYVYGTEVEGNAVQSCLQTRTVTDAATRGASSLCTGLLAYLPVHLTPADNSNIPVLAFWKPEPLPEKVSKYCVSKKDDIGRIIIVGGKANNPLDRIPCVAQRMYTLVVYSLNTENSSGTWKGRARIKRYTLPHFSEDFTSDTIKSGWVPPVAADDQRPLSWPFGKDKDNRVNNLQISSSSATIPGAGSPSATPAENVVLTDFVDFALDANGKPRVPEVLTSAPDKNSGYCPYNFEVANFGKFRPEFYACVRRASINENPEVRVVIKGNAAGRGGIPYATGEAPFQMESNVVGRGVYSRQRSGS